MKVRGFLAMLIMGSVVVYLLMFLRSGKRGTSLVEEEIRQFDRTRIELTAVNLSQIERAVLTYQASAGELPASLAEVSRARILTGGTADAWGRSVRYEKTSDSGFRLVSAGPDGRFDTEDDIARDY